ncbi:transmembrane protein 107-like [Lycorma delicatula]|uniref:transmembrane protein 107-like n=1 Tax=Lycorma delicatula TaxID=130591 RepID=UPI003F512899
MTVLCADGLIPARFLTLLAHLTILIVTLWARDEIVVSCLPYDYNGNDYGIKITEMIIGLSLAIGFIGIELIGFMSGLSMFMPSASVFSIGCHSTASILLSYALFDEWDCSLYWWIFAMCSLPPGLFEIIYAFSQIVLKKI